ncbi:MAG: DUF87 domain-containing protein, partial [Candidatus Aenigmarchaeota archaeon]|nr:DUF87 domain-containing protein [Candidatus Aenigmarchaeota archaeon]
MIMDIVNKQVHIGDRIKAEITLKNIGYLKEINATVEYILYSNNYTQIYSTADNISFQDTISYIKEINTSAITEQGEYILRIEVHYNGKKTDKIQSVTLTKPFWTKSRLNMSLIFILLLAAICGGYYAVGWYKREKSKKARYIFPLDFKKLPKLTKDALLIGRIAETNINAYFDKNDITTHILTAGATGAGKSVAASILVEEALKKNVAVVVFDPTAQWSGFVRPCKDNNLL